MFCLACLSALLLGGVARADLVTVPFSAQVSSIVDDLGRFSGVGVGSTVTGTLSFDPAAFTSTFTDPFSGITSYGFQPGASAGLTVQSGSTNLAGTSVTDFSIAVNPSNPGGGLTATAVLDGNGSVAQLSFVDGTGSVVTGPSLPTSSDFSHFTSGQLMVRFLQGGTTGADGSLPPTSLLTADVTGLSGANGVPEPGTLALAVVGAVLAGGLARRRHRKTAGRAGLR
jgi:hypothetical protein